MSYLSGSFSIYSEKYTLVGNKVIEVQAYLVNYPEIKSGLVSSTTEITDPCLDPFTLDLPIGQ